MISRLFGISAVLAFAALVAGCGGGSSSGVSQSSPQAALKSYDLAWAEGNASEACELLADEARRAVETEMSNRTVGGLPLNCETRMKEVLELLGPEDKQAAQELAKATSSDKVEEEGDEASVSISPVVVMSLRKVGDCWYVHGGDIKEIEPFVTKEEIEEVQAEEQTELDEAVKKAEEENPNEGINRAENTGPGPEVKKAESMASESVETVSGETVEFVTCPGPITPEKGDRFTCDLSTASGTHYQSEMEVFDPAGGLVVLRSFVSHEH